jgi:type II secretory pathway component PulF
MPAYNYRAAAFDSGRIRRGKLFAVNEQDLAQNLRTAGLELIDAKANNDNNSKRLTAKLPPRQLSALLIQFHDLIAAEIPFVDALQQIRGRPRWAACMTPWPTFCAPLITAAVSPVPSPPIRVCFRRS